jgi:hypothetical protein
MSPLAVSLRSARPSDGSVYASPLAISPNQPHLSNAHPERRRLKLVREDPHSNRVKAAWIFGEIDRRPAHQPVARRKAARAPRKESHFSSPRALCTELPKNGNHRAPAPPSQRDSRSAAKEASTSPGSATRYCRRPSLGDFSSLSSRSAWMRSMVARAASTFDFAVRPGSEPCRWRRRPPPPAPSRRSLPPSRPGRGRERRPVPVSTQPAR